MSNMSQHPLGIPNEIWVKHILTHLNQRELAKTALLSREFKVLARTSVLWKRLELYASPSMHHAAERSMDAFSSFIEDLVNIETINIILKDTRNDNYQGEPIDDVKTALKILLIKNSSIKAIGLHLNNNGLSECEPIYNIVEDHGSNIESIKIIEDSNGTFWRWEDLTKKFLLVAPTFWSHLKKVELKDGGIRQIMVDDGALVKVIQSCPILQTLIINSGSMLKALEIFATLKAMEEHGEMKLFQYRTIWDIMDNNRTIRQKCFKSKLFNAGIKYDEYENTMLIYAYRR